MRTCLAVSIALALAVSACNKKSTESTGEGAQKVEAKGGSSDKIGVAECDDYLAKMQACLKDVPAEGKPAMEQALKANRDSWAEMAKDSATKAALGTACKAALDGLKSNPVCNK